MSEKRNRLLLPLCLLIVVTAAIIVIAVAPDARLATANGRGNEAASVSSAQDTRQTPHPAFTLTLTRTSTSVQTDQPRLRVTTRRDQRSDGAFRLVHTFHAEDGSAVRTDTYFGVAGVGTFRVDERRRRLVFDTPMLDEQPANLADFLRSHPQFVREESVHGLNAFVWRRERGEGFIEEYRALALGGLLVKRVEATAAGREIVEPTGVAMGEPSPALFAGFVQYAADYASFEQRIAEMDGRRRHGAANVMRRALQRMRQIKP